MKDIWHDDSRNIWLYLGAYGLMFSCMEYNDGEGGKMGGGGEGGEKAFFVKPGNKYHGRERDRKHLCHNSVP